MRHTILRLCLVCVLLLATMSMTVSAEQPESMNTLSKVYTFTATDTEASITMEPEIPAFWEYPILRNGETYTEGTLVLKNDSPYAVNMMLNEVVLPYGDSAKLAYLNNLDVVVKDGNKVIYNNTYAHINDPEDGLKIEAKNMSPGVKRVYTIQLKCQFDYEGDATKDVSQLTWVFGASTQTTTYDEPDGLPTWLVILLIVMGVAIAAVSVVMVIRVLKKKAK